MKQRPILVAIIGYIIGIIWGLYLKSSIVLFYILLFAIYYIYIKFFNFNKKRKFKLLSINRYKRYIKLIINKKVILILIIFSIISNAIIIQQNSEYKNTYEDEEDIQLIGIITSSKIEKEYYDLYKIKISDSKFYMYVQIQKNQKEFQYGDKISIEGKYKKPSEQRNYGGYDYSKYLKTLKIIGQVQVNKIELLEKEQLNIILQFANNIKTKIEANIDKILNSENAKIAKGLLLGNKEEIEDE